MEPTSLARSRSRYKGNRPSSTSLLSRLESKPQGAKTNQEPKTSQRRVDISNVRKPLVDAASTLSSTQSVVIQQALPKRTAVVAEAGRMLSSSKERSTLDRNGLAMLPSEQQFEGGASLEPTEQRQHKAAYLSFRDKTSRQLRPKNPHQTTTHDPSNVKRVPGPYTSKELVVPKPREKSSKTEELRVVQASPAKPAFDAPISAVNAGERRVAVQHRDSVISVLITPSTTSVDLVCEASQQIGIPPDLDQMLVLESFRRLGLERPLRKYENIRSILNSWDFDAQNALILTRKMDFGTKHDIDAHFSGDRPGEDVSATMYYSQRPRHWDKQTFTLRSDGQILVTKKGVSSNVCHLSDFDIYIPTRSQLSKTVKPPKKLCFAIKSQQKSSMFLSTENFVHFFCTKDKATAKLWFTAVQSWRGWYLLTVMGQGQTQIIPEAESVDKQQSHRIGATNGAETVNVNGLSPVANQICNGGPSFNSKPLAPAKESSSTQDSRSRGLDHPDVPREPFSSNGLLGRTYTKRKQAQEQRAEKSVERAGRTVLASPILSATSRIPGSGNTAPLVDLTPQYQEPPQHRRGRGVTPAVMPSGGLVEVATTPDTAIHIPPSTSWKHDQTPARSLQRTGTTRSRNQWRPSNNTGEKLVPSLSNHTATPQGLIFTDNPSQGALGHGRGVRTGDRNANSPLLDMHERSQYAPGSLLASVENYEGGERKPVVEREHTEEVRVTTGEV